VQVFDKDGTFITRLGSEGNGKGQFSAPESIDIDSAGEVYVADTTNNNIQMFVPRN